MNPSERLKRWRVAGKPSIRAFSQLLWGSDWLICGRLAIGRVDSAPQAKRIANPLRDTIRIPSCPTIFVKMLQRIVQEITGHPPGLAWGRPSLLSGLPSCGYQTNADDEKRSSARRCVQLFSGHYTSCLVGHRLVTDRLAGQCLQGRQPLDAMLRCSRRSRLTYRFA